MNRMFASIMVNIFKIQISVRNARAQRGHDTWVQRGAMAEVKGAAWPLLST